MNCQKCGASLPPGCLYCEECGNEYQIVPDFEPEIENSMAESLSDVIGSIDDNTKDLSIANDVKNETGKQTAEEDILFDNNSKSTNKGQSFYLTAIITGIILFLSIAAYIIYTDSGTYLEKQALKAEKSEKYNEALLYYEELRRKEPKNSKWYLKEAEFEIYFGNTDNALQLGYMCIENTIENSEAFRLVLSLLVDKKDYKELYRVLQLCNYDEIKEDFKKYNSQVGALSHEGGRYEEIIHIEIMNASKNTFYTLDGSTPDQNAIPYEGAIVLGKGKHTLSFITYNDFGIPSQILRKEYLIDTTTPLAPKVLPESGIKTDAAMVEIEIEEGTKVYYTTDGSNPTSNSILYEAPVPIPLGESNFTFVAISEEGTIGEYTYRNYTMSLKTHLSTSRAEKILMERLISAGHILDMNGAIEARYGVFRYYYNFPIYLDGKNYYVFEEHYLENLINNRLGNYYIVDVLSGEVFSLLKDFTGKFYKGYF